MSSSKSKKGPTTHVLSRWLVLTTAQVGHHPLYLMVEIAGSRTAVLTELRDLVRAHYVSPVTTAKRLAELGAPKTAKLLREHLPKTKTARSGDLGEVLATEIAEQTLKYAVPIRRLRWKDGRNMALRGDDIVGVRIEANGSLSFLKGESKSRAALSTAVLDEASEALDRDRGRPTRHSVLFVADRLRESKQDVLAQQLEEAALLSFRANRVEHLLLVFTGSNPKNLLNDHLVAASKKRRKRNAVGVRILDHGAFIDLLFGGM